MFKGDFKIILVYSLILLSFINFTRQINRKIGYGVLLNFILGRYRKPREEERIFAFIDLKGSTEIAEKLGALQFHKLLYEFFHDISLSILVTKGEIYRYVGDAPGSTIDLEAEVTAKAFVDFKVDLGRLSQ